MNWIEPKKYYAQLPKKRISTGVLLFNSKNELLLVKPTYKDHWTLPGGCIDQDESPYDGAKREIKEETGLSLQKMRLINIEYRLRDNHQTEAIFFSFYGGKLSKKQIEKIQLPADELSDFKFVSLKQAKQMLSKTVGKKLDYFTKAIKNKSFYYLENGQLKSS